MIWYFTHFYVDIFKFPLFLHLFLSTYWNPTQFHTLTYEHVCIFFTFENVYISEEKINFDSLFQISSFWNLFITLIMAAKMMASLMWDNICCADCTAHILTKKWLPFTTCNIFLLIYDPNLWIRTLNILIAFWMAQIAERGNFAN